MSSPSSSNAQSSDASSVSTSDPSDSSLREQAVYEASGDNDSSVFTVIGDWDTTSSPMGSQTDLSGSSEQDMSETRLRQLYDEEEIERYLHLFSAVSSCRTRWVVYPEVRQVCNRSETTRCFA
jgi:hypothetical protein